MGSRKRRLTMKTDIGVVVGRFQVHSLHEAHHELLKAVMAKHDKVIVFLGVAPAKSTKHNPMDFKAREMMLREAYPNLTILPLYDMGNDHEWSKQLDKKIREVFALGTVTLYGSRDAFIPRYFGTFPTVELESRHTVSGSEIRKSLSNKIIGSAEFRHGLIYSTYDRYPISYTTVDAAVLSENGEVLLGHKITDPEDTYRFIGGFVDINKDDSLESAVKREVMEETNSIGVGDPEYIGSAKIHDWRYRDEQDGIMTSFFKIPYVFGAAKPGDDMDELEWVDLAQLFSGSRKVVPEHEVLVALLKADLNRQQKKENKNGK
jgi:bifunctional NMN adenylyltransferase/nudix hydrolase